MLSSFVDSELFLDGGKSWATLDYLFQQYKGYCIEKCLHPYETSEAKFDGFLAQRYPEARTVIDQVLEIGPTRRDYILPVVYYSVGIKTHRRGAYP